MSAFLGLDTSNYTTSAAVFDGESGVNLGKLLEVPAGTLGLRQSEALFQHVRRLPQLLSLLREQGALGRDLAAVGASTRPREVEGSYMPCFLVGEGMGRGIADVLARPFVPVSHQQGHLAAAAWSAGRLDLLDRPFLAWHLSGGTTELLMVEPNGGIPNAKRIGGTSDISAGQLIDRTGVLLGLSFPAGKALDQLSCSVQDALPPLPRTLNGSEFSLSGVENKVKALAERGTDRAQIAAYVMDTVAQAVYTATEAARRDRPELPVLCSGGVASGTRLRRVLSAGCGAIFAQPQYSTDNAMGAAILACRSYERGETM